MTIIYKRFYFQVEYRVMLRILQNGPLMKTISKWRPLYLDPEVVSILIEAVALKHHLVPVSMNAIWCSCISMFCGIFKISSAKKDSI